MGINTKVEVDFSNLHAEVNKYFEGRLKLLGLSMSSLKRQSEEELRRNLIVVQHAMDKHESYGKFGVRLSAQGSAFIVGSKSESTFEVGILPLLLERYQLILKRLEEFDKEKQLKSQDAKLRNDNIRAELTKIASGEINRRFWIFVAILSVIWATMFFLIQRFGWDKLEPWTYLIGIGMVIGGYIYFAIRQREFSPFTIYQHAFDTRKKQLFQIFGVEE